MNASILLLLALATQAMAGQNEMQKVDNLLNTQDKPPKYYSPVHRAGMAAIMAAITPETDSLGNEDAAPPGTESLKALKEKMKDAQARATALDADASQVEHDAGQAKSESLLEANTEQVEYEDKSEETMNMNTMAVETVSVEQSSSPMNASSLLRAYPPPVEESNPWTNSANLNKIKSEVEKRIKEIVDNKRNDNKENGELMETMFLIESQRIINEVSMECADLCAICLPVGSTPQKQKSIFMERSKGFKDKAKMVGLGPADAIAGAAKGAAVGAWLGITRGVGTGVVAGTVAGISTEHWKNNKNGKGDQKEWYEMGAGHVMGAVVGTAAGAVTAGVTTAALVAALEMFLPLWGAFHGVGFTGNHTRCSRLGFEAFTNGAIDEQNSFKSVKNNKSSYGLKLLRGAVQSTDDETWLTHCESMREHNFDVRHVPFCMKHSKLCGGQSVRLLPGDRGFCQDMSDGDKAVEDVSDLKTDSLKGKMRKIHGMTENLKMPKTTQ